jgi:hypothetical protein
MPTDQRSHVAAPSQNGKTLGKRLHRFLVPVPKLEPPINPALLKREQQRAEARQNRVADKDHRFFGIDALCLPPHHLVRSLDRLRRGGLPVRPPDEDRLARGHLPLDLRDDLPEPRRRQAPGDRRPAVEDGPGGGQAERGAARPLQADPLADQGGSRSRGSAWLRRLVIRLGLELAGNRRFLFDGRLAVKPAAAPPNQPAPRFVESSSFLFRRSERRSFLGAAAASQFHAGPSGDQKA